MTRKEYLQSLPLYEMVINEDEDDNTGVRFISLVEDPAIEVKGMYFKKKDKWKGEGNSLPPVHPNCFCRLEPGDDGYSVWRIEPDACDVCYEKREIFNSGNRRSKNRDKKGRGDVNKPKSSGFEEMAFSVNKDRKVIVGPAMIPDIQMFRSDESGDYLVTFTKEQIQTTVNKFNKGNNNKSINVDHSNRLVKGFIQASWIVEDVYYDKSRMYGFDCPVGTWFVELKIEDDDFWEKEVKGLGKFGFSIEGIMGHRLVELSNQEYYDFEIDDEHLRVSAKELLDLVMGVVSSDDLDGLKQSLNEPELHLVFKSVSLEDF